MALQMYWKMAAGTDLHCQSSTEEYSVRVKLVSAGRYYFFMTCFHSA